MTTFYLIGVQPGLYDAVFPVFITGDSPSQLEFRVEKDVNLGLIGAARVDVALRAPDREYATRAV